MVKAIQFNSKHAFWQALVFTVVVFAIGLMFGFFLEDARANEVRLGILDAEISILDDQLRNRIIEDFQIGCDVAHESTFGFADRIYQDALQLEDYTAATYFSNDRVESLHQRYDLLRALLWAESVELKKRCPDFHTVIYLYEFETEHLDTDSRQLYYSRLVADLKEKYPDEVLLIPIAVDTGLDSISLVMQEYNIEETPAILIDETYLVNDIVTLEELENLLFGVE